MTEPTDVKQTFVPLGGFAGLPVRDRRQLADDAQKLIDAWNRCIPADCLGLRGLPSVRAELDALVEQVCHRLRIAGEKGLRGRQLAEELNLTGTRALRLLVAYAQVGLGRTEIVGVPGAGYVWGPAAPAARATMARSAHKMGLDWLRKSRDYSHPAGRQLELGFARGLER